jgi:hypothetical protein
MPGSFDDIIRGVLNGMSMPRPVENKPFGNDLGPMIDDWLRHNDPSTQPSYAEDEPMPHPAQQRDFSNRDVDYGLGESLSAQRMPLGPDSAYDPNRLTLDMKRKHSPWRLFLEENGLVPLGTDI